VRPLAAFIAGILAGAAILLAVALGRGLWTRSADPPAPAPARSRGDEELRAALERAQAEVALLRAQVAELARRPASVPVDAAIAVRESADNSEDDRPPADALSATLEVRSARAREILALLDEDPVLRELLSRQSREESAFPNWTAAQFWEDPAVNPRSIELGEAQRQRFALLHARAHERVRRLDLERQLAISEAIARRIEARLAGADPLAAEHAPETVEDDEAALRIRLRAGLDVVLSRAEFPEVFVLEEEKQAAVLDWLFEAIEFFASL
jgi:hypothetical protein